ncbi:hypothetical protein KCU81_g6033, partial [Aureobasidium melanogenum]|uniref:Uncharacterized protein n=1 Tax=Aureobasidium melanogenum (strain CBS 110374) TaxID=1043003 RepID=A0A074VZS9_AURM1
MADIQGLREQIAANFKFMKLQADNPEIVILKRGQGYHAVIAETDRVKHALTMERPMPTVIAALEYLLDMTSEHLGNIHDTFFTDRATPPTQFGEIVENDLFLSAGSYYRPDLTPDETPESSPSTAESIRESIERESSEQVSAGITPPPTCSSVALANRLPTPFASSSPSPGRARPPRRRASEMEAIDTDDTARENTLRRSTRIRHMRDQ